MTSWQCLRKHVTAVILPIALRSTLYLVVIFKPKYDYGSDLFNCIVVYIFDIFGDQFARVMLLDAQKKQNSIRIILSRIILTTLDPVHGNPLPHGVYCPTVAPQLKNLFPKL